jgi:hypothetical protein
MKKFSSKFIASAVMAVIAASAMAISSSAAIDYYDNPQYHIPEYTGNASGLQQVVLPQAAQIPAARQTMIQQMRQILPNPQLAL